MDKQTGVNLGGIHWEIHWDQHWDKKLEMREFPLMSSQEGMEM